MKRKLKIIWIDDDPQRESVANNLGNNLGAKVDFKKVKGKKMEEVITGILNNPPPDLFIIDHRLQFVQSTTFKAGSTVAAVLREMWPQYPVVGITAANIKNDIVLQQREAYEDIYSSLTISRHYKTIYSITKSFRTLREKPPQDLKQLLGFMKAPSSDHSKILSIMPQELKENIKDESILIDISRWIRKTFLERPGFVYDRLWVSTLLGLTEGGFAKVETKFSPAKYKGIFSDDSNDKWWKSRVLQVLSNAVQTAGLPWERGRQLSDFTKVDFSKSYSGEGIPEIVAFLDETPGSERKPMRMRETVPHPNYEDLLFFDEIRMMSNAR